VNHSLWCECANHTASSASSASLALVRRQRRATRARLERARRPFHAELEYLFQYGVHVASPSSFDIWWGFNRKVQHNSRWILYR